MTLMIKKMLPNILILCLAFGGLAYWFGTQPDLKIKLKESVNNSNRVSAFTETENSISSTTQPPQNVETVIEETFINNDSTPAVEESADMKNIREAFATKYNKSIQSIFAVLESKEGSFAKGSVDFDNSGYGANFYAYYDSTAWIIVAVENGVVACSTIAGYNFPSSMIPQCYDQSSGAVVSR